MGIGGLMIRIFIILLFLCFPAYAQQDMRVVDSVTSGFKANVKKVGNDYGIQDMSLEKGLQVQMDYSGGINAIYVGWSTPGALTSAATWRIIKMTYDVNNNVTQVQFADQVNTFTKIFDNRAAYDYTP